MTRGERAVSSNFPTLFLCKAGFLGLSEAKNDATRRLQIFLQ